MSRPFVSLPDLFAETPTEVALEATLNDAAPPPTPSQVIRLEDLVNEATQVGAIIGDRYELEALIAEGGMGRVFRVRHRTLGKRFALKLMHHTYLQDSRLRELFYREARLASSLSHPNIVSVVDYGEDPSLRAYMVMELVEGEPLLKRLQQGFLPIRLACEIVLQIAEALHYVHLNHIVHCDLKPENILLCEDHSEGRRRTTIKLLDFGLARLRESKTSQRLDGTPEYMAPEKILGKPPTPSMDVYGAGVLFYAMLAGRLPFRGSLEEVLEGHLRGTPEPPSQLRGEPIDERAEALVMKALAKDPADRQKDMAAFIYEVKTLMDMLGYGKRRGFVRATTLPQAEGRTRDAAHMFDIAPVPLAAVDIDGHVVIANNAFAQFVTGSPETGMAGQDLMATKLVEICPWLPADLRRVHVQGESIERRFGVRRSSGAPLRMVMQLYPGTPGRFDAIMCIFAVGREGS